MPAIYRPHQHQLVFYMGLTGTLVSALNLICLSFFVSRSTERIEGTTQQQGMDNVKQKRVESAVIGDVVNNFVPRLQLHVVYGHDRITFGDRLPLSVFQSMPDDVKLDCDDDDLEMKDNLKNRKFVIVMTDPERTPGSEYLHWLITDYNTTKCHGRVVPWQELVPYEPPTATLSGKIVFTVYYQNQSWASKPQLRVLFSKRVFARTNALGCPLGAAFYCVKDQEDNQKAQKNVDHDSQRVVNQNNTKRWSGT